MRRDRRQQQWGPGGRLFKAGLSVRQEITYTDGLRDFFNTALYPRLQAAVPEDAAANRYERRARGYQLADERLYEDEATGAKSLAITLAERGLTGRAAERFGVRWRPCDIGRVRGRLANECTAIRERLGLPLGALLLTLDGAQRVGNWRTNGEGRCIALTPAPDDPVAEYLLRVDFAADEILRREIAGYQRPGDAIMHFTVARFGTQVPSKLIGESVQQVRDAVRARPLTIELGNMVARGYDEQSATIGYPAR